MNYEPKEGTDWQAGTTMYADVRRWQAQVEQDVWLQVTTTEGGMFVISRRMGDAHTVPHPGDLGRVERDFGVRAWSIQGVMPTFAPSSGLALLAKAVEV